VAINIASSKKISNENMNQSNVKLISSSKDAGRSWKTGSFLIIVLLMISILTVSFYEPKWVHSGTFAGIETDESEFGIEPPIEKSKSFQFDDLRDRITSTSRRSKLSGALQSFTVTPSTLMYNSNEVFAHFPSLPAFNP
jgi:hypothetical protein